VGTSWLPRSMSVDGFAGSSSVLGTALTIAVVEVDLRRNSAFHALWGAHPCPRRRRSGQGGLRVRRRQLASV
jgi:hypothetical protein